MVIAIYYDVDVERKLSKEAFSRGGVSHAVVCLLLLMVCTEESERA